MSAHYYQGEGVKSTPYGIWLIDQGFVYPALKKPGLRYTNVDGYITEIDPARPFAVVTYAPYKSERHFPSFRAAMHALPEKGHYQVINLLTGGIVYEPYHVMYTDQEPNAFSRGLRRYYYV